MRSRWLFACRRRQQRDYGKGVAELDPLPAAELGDVTILATNDHHAGPPDLQGSLAGLARIQDEPEPGGAWPQSPNDRP
jgi:hypothetical protein